MRKLQQTRPIRHAIIWIAVYIVTVNIGDALGEQLQFPGLTSILLLALSTVLLVYLRVGRRFASIGIRAVQPGTLPSTFFYLPLFAIAFAQYAKGFTPTLDLQAVTFAVLLVAAVGFIEELLFRGFLLNALRTRGSVDRAIVISGVTFGLGHIVNLLRGYSVTDQALQLVAAVLIGVALAYCAVLTGSILPGVVFHALFNLSGTITNHSTTLDTVIVGGIALVMIGYIITLRGHLARSGPASAEYSSAAGVTRPVPG